MTDLEGPEPGSPELCQCQSCKTARMRAGDVCKCCGGRRLVTSIVGDLRPCSRCRAEQFDSWAKAQREQPANR